MELMVDLMSMFCREDFEVVWKSVADPHPFTILLTSTPSRLFIFRLPCRGGGGRQYYIGTPYGGSGARGNMTLEPHGGPGVRGEAIL